ncbi:MAG: hypothetical protein Fur003_4830 [Candidatus Dojkabacteria bacterium]
MLTFGLLIVAGLIVAAVAYKQGGYPRCEYNGKVFKNGDGFKDKDNCNSCSCANGEVVCTTMACDTETPAQEPGDNDSENVTSYNGTYVTAELPDEWKITEGINGVGGVLMDDTVYKGPTSITVSHNNIEKFKIYALDGVGGSNVCTKYPQFEDFNVNHFNTLAAEAAEIQETTVLVDYTNANIFEFTSVGQNYRRVGTELYRDLDLSNATFEPSCAAMDKMTFVAEELYFKLEAGNQSQKLTLYGFKYLNDLSSDELLTLDNILESLKIKQYSL